MSQKQIYSEIMTGHRERMINLRKYYPFFKLCENSFAQFRDGKYAMLDMGYIVMAALRFFIEENNFKEKDVVYPEYLAFMERLLERDFGLKLSEEEAREVSDYIFDKMKNDGKPFTFEYYDPQAGSKRMLRTKLIESRIKNSTVWYSISSDAVEFYLDTKEVRDESRISVQQLLLEKLIQSSNFRGGTEIVEKINNEVALLMSRKNEVLSILSVDVFAGVEAYQDFVETGMRWFDDEQRLFLKNKELIESVYAKAERERDDSDKYYENLQQIHKLDTQLKIAMNRHGELLRTCTELKMMADDIIRKSRLRRLRSCVDFRHMLEGMMREDNMTMLGAMVQPLLHLNIKKQFNLTSIDDMLRYRPEKPEMAEKIENTEIVDIVYEDEAQEERIRENIAFFMQGLWACAARRETFTLSEYAAWVLERTNVDLFKNGDFYTFLVHLCQKKMYLFEEDSEAETFLDGMIQEMDKSHVVSFRILTEGAAEEDTIAAGGGLFTNIRFERIQKNV